MTYMYTLHKHNPKPTLTLYLDYMIYIYDTYMYTLHIHNPKHTLTLNIDYMIYIYIYI